MRRGSRLSADLTKSPSPGDGQTAPHTTTIGPSGASAGGQAVHGFHDQTTEDHTSQTEPPSPGVSPCVLNGGAEAHRHELPSHSQVESVGIESESNPVERKSLARLPALRLMAGLRLIISTTILSRVLGAFRDTATATLFGISPIMDAFAFAFRIPNLARRLFGEGALTAAFLPAFTRTYESTTKEGHRPAWQLATAILTLLAVILSILVLLVEIALYWWRPEIGDGHELVFHLTSIMFPYTVLICVAAQVTAILQALGRFGWSSFVPIVLNICWLIGVYSAKRLIPGNPRGQAELMAVAILIAGVLQLTVQLPQLYRLGFRLDFDWKPVWSEIKTIAIAILPSTIALSITQINSVLDSLIALMFSRPVEGPSTMPLPGNPLYPLEPGAVSALYFGERIYQFPLGVFGVALGTVLFPLLTRHAARGEFGRLRDDLSLALRLVLVVGIPASLGLMAVAEPMTKAMLQHGEFGASDAHRTAQMIIAYSFGVWAYCGLPVLFRGFYAMNDRQTPLRIGLCAVVFDTILNLILIWPLAEQGLASSTAVSAILQLSLLTWLLQRRLGTFDWPRLRMTAGKTVAAGLIMLLVVRCVQYMQPDWSDWFVPKSGVAARWIRVVGDLVTLAIPVVVGGVVYIACAAAFGISEVWMLLKRDHGDESTERFDGSASLES